MTEELKKAFDNLSIDEKRNALNTEMRFTFNIIKVVKQYLNLNPRINDINNYDIINDKNMTEEEMLNLLYEDFFNIQKEILDISEQISTTN